MPGRIVDRSFPFAGDQPGCWRMIPSRFPPIHAFETVATADDLEAVMELEGWTNDRLVVERLKRLPKGEWCFGRANASVVMAAFLHAAPAGTRFAGADLGAWYASVTVRTAAREVIHHLRRERAASGLAELQTVYRAYTADLVGRFVDIRGAAPDLHQPGSYAAAQVFGEAVRAGPHAGIVYDSVRDAGGVNVVCYRPSRILDVRQGDHFRIRVPAVGRITVERLRAPPA